jgi:hypothetical protein
VQFWNARKRIIFCKHVYRPEFASEQSRVRFESSPERSLTPPMPAPRPSFRPESPNPFMRPGTRPESPNSFMRPGTRPESPKAFSRSGTGSFENSFPARSGSPKPFDRSSSPLAQVTNIFCAFSVASHMVLRVYISLRNVTQGLSLNAIIFNFQLGRSSSPPRPVPPPQRALPDPNLPPQPVPPPAVIPPKQKLSMSELERLPQPMSMRERVMRLGKKGPETPPSPMMNNSDNDDNIDDASTPELTSEHRSVIWPGKSTTSTFDDTFNIDTTKSFLDSSKPSGVYFYDSESYYR